MDTTREQLNRARNFASRRYNFHRKNGDCNCHWSFAVGHALEDTLAKWPDIGYGVEGDTEENGEGHITMDYINTGDIYALTIVHYRGKFRVTSWGDCVEEHERRQA